MDVQVLTLGKTGMEVENLENIQSNNTTMSKKRSHSGKENDQSNTAEDFESSPKRTKTTTLQQDNGALNSSATPSASETLLNSLSGSLSEEMKAQLTSSESVIQALAAKMAEEIAAKKIQEMQGELKPSSSQTVPDDQSDQPVTPSVKEKSPPNAKPEESLPKVDNKQLEKQRKEQEKVNKEKERQLEKERKELEKQLEKEKKELERQQEREKKELEKQKEKERKELEKQQKEAERLEKKEQERLKKEAEKLKREEEKRKRDDEKRQKLEEKRKKEDDKKKQIEDKERQQLRLASFFQVKKSSPVKTAPPPQEVTSDYDTLFLPFYQKANVFLCQPTAFSHSEESLDTARSSLDRLLEGKPAEKDTLGDWLKSKRVQRGYRISKLPKDIVQMSNSEKTSEAELVKSLQALPQKFIRFAEHLRPPYVGTFCKSRETGIPRNDPFFKTGTGFNYDYDSEIEWTQEDDEGEDIDMDEISDEGDDEDDDMDEFVANDDTPIARRMIVGPLTPTSLWNDGMDNQDTFSELEIDVLTFGHYDSPSIDPFKDYWSPPSASPTKQQTATPSKDTLVLALTNSTKKPKKLIASTDMKAFVTKINGTDMNQIMLVETLKKE